MWFFTPLKPQLQSDKEANGNRPFIPVGHFPWKCMVVIAHQSTTYTRTFRVVVPTCKPRGESIRLPMIPSPMFPALSLTLPMIALDGPVSFMEYYLLFCSLDANYLMRGPAKRDRNLTARSCHSPSSTILYIEVP
jgi:hypothetical protein